MGSGFVVGRLVLLVKLQLARNRLRHAKRVAYITFFAGIRFS
jgi:hypothetical protein